MGDVSLSFAGAGFQPLPCGALWWPAESALLVADLHLEKGSHYARRGWMLPPHDSERTLLKLVDAWRTTGAQRIIALGDSFHDADGPARMPHAALVQLKTLLAAVDWLWITGNHDADSGALLGGRSMAEEVVQGIALRHESQAGAPGAEISGHFHPKVMLGLRTGGRVSRRCLAITATRMVLPAYGSFAGGLSVADPVFARALGAAPEAVVPLHNGRLIRVPPTTGKDIAA